MEVPLSAEQLALAPLGSPVQVVVEVERAPGPGQLEATLLEATEPGAETGSYRRSELPLTVLWDDRTTVVMGGAEGLASDAVLRVHGRTRDRGVIIADLIAVSTGMTSVEG